MRAVPSKFRNYHRRSCTQTTCILSLMIILSIAFITVRAKKSTVLLIHALQIPPTKGRIADNRQLSRRHSFSTHKNSLFHDLEKSLLMSKHSHNDVDGIDEVPAPLCCTDRVVEGGGSSSSETFDITHSIVSAAPVSNGKKLSNEPIDNAIEKPDYGWTKATLAIGIPALIGMLADPLLSLMDTAFVGHIGSIELAALGACTSIFHLAFNAFRATTTATTILVSTALAKVEDASLINTGENKADEVRFTIDTSLRIGVIMGVCVSSFLVFGARFVLKAMGVPASSALFGPGKSYLQIRALAAPAVLMITVAEGAFRGYGDTRTPLLASMVAAGMNLVLDPLLMFPLKMGISGAAAATAISQIGAALLYWIFLRKRRMLPQRTIVEKPRLNQRVSSKMSNVKKTTTRKLDRTSIALAILRANAAMVAKQGSLLFAWAYASSRATRIGHAHVAAHQVALSFWLVFVLIMDGAAVSAQVLMARCWGAFLNSVNGDSTGVTTDSTISEYKHGSKNVNNNGRAAIRSLTYYMIKFAIVQGLVSSALILSLGKLAPLLFTTDPIIQMHLSSLMPHIAWQQVLVSLTLVMEGLAVGGSKFGLLAVGTTVSTFVAIRNLSRATDIVNIWSVGLVSLFVGRLITSIIGVLDVNGFFDHTKKVLFSRR